MFPNRRCGSPPLNRSNPPAPSLQPIPFPTSPSFSAIYSLLVRSQEQEHFKQTHSLSFFNQFQSIKVSFSLLSSFQKLQDTPCSCSQPNSNLFYPFLSLFHLFLLLSLSLSILASFQLKLLNHEPFPHRWSNSYP